MQHYVRPRLVAYGNVSDLTKSKISTGTDSFFGGQPQPGACIGIVGTTIVCDSASQDAVVMPPLP